MLSSHSNLYMFAIMPPPDLSARIHNERLNFAEEYGFEKALKPPVHITLFDPFLLSIPTSEVFEKQISKMQNWADYQTPFGIELRNFGYFDKNIPRPVLFIDVLRSEQILNLHSGFVQELKKHMEIEKQKNQYIPHFTIGYRDIPLDAFPEIKAAYSKRKFTASFECNAFYLWKHNTKNWQVLQEFRLKGMKDQLSLF